MTLRYLIYAGYHRLTCSVCHPGILNRLNHQRGDGIVDAVLVLALAYIVVTALTFITGWLFP